MSDFIPNTFSTPNAYVDRFMHLLTGEEYKVLSYMARRIFGFQKRQDRISMSQMETGQTGRDGDKLDYGTGLSHEGIRTALSALQRFKLVAQVAPADHARQIAALWELQLESAAVDVAGLELRLVEKRASNKNRTQKALKKRHPLSPTDPVIPPQSHRDYPLSPTDRPPSVPLTHKSQEKNIGNTVCVNEEFSEPQNNGAHTLALESSEQPKTETLRKETAPTDYISQSEKAPITLRESNDVNLLRRPARGCRRFSELENAVLNALGNNIAARWDMGHLPYDKRCAISDGLDLFEKLNYAPADVAAFMANLGAYTNKPKPNPPTIEQLFGSFESILNYAPREVVEAPRVPQPRSNAVDAETTRREMEAENARRADIMARRAAQGMAI